MIIFFRPHNQHLQEVRQLKDLFRVLPVLLGILTLVAGCDNGNTLFDPANLEQRIDDNNDFAFTLLDGTEDGIPWIDTVAHKTLHFG